MLVDWQLNLVSEIVKCLEGNYIFPEKIDSSFREQLEAQFIQQFSTYIEESDICHDWSVLITKGERESEGSAVDSEIQIWYVDERKFGLHLKGTPIYTTYDEFLLNAGPEVFKKIIDTIRPDQFDSTTGKFSDLDEDCKYAIRAKIFAYNVERILGGLLGDPHVQLYYMPTKIAQDAECIREHRVFPSALGLHQEVSEERRRAVLDDQCGFRDIAEQDKEKIPENIGYVKIASMHDVNYFPEVKQRIFQEMQKLQGKQGVIIDLRNNRGGSMEAVQQIISFFTKEPKHFETIAKREGAEFKNKELWTLPREALNPGGEFEGQPTPDLSESPVYILIGQATFSGGEALAYDMRQLLKDQVRLVGSVSKGGAHGGCGQPLWRSEDVFNEKFLLGVPNSTFINPFTQTNWEDDPKGRGVQPDIHINEGEDALDIALREIVRREALSLPSSQHGAMFSGVDGSNAGQQATFTKEV